MSYYTVCTKLDRKALGIAHFRWRRGGSGSLWAADRISLFGTQCGCRYLPQCDRLCCAASVPRFGRSPCGIVSRRRADECA